MGNILRHTGINIGGLNSISWIYREDVGIFSFNLSTLSCIIAPKPGKSWNAIYGTRPVAPYKESPVVFTRKGHTVFAIFLTAGEGDGPPERVTLAALRPSPNSKIHLLGVSKALAWQTAADGRTTIEVPAAVRKSPPCHHAFVFQFTPAND